MLIEKIKKGLDSTYYLLGVVIAMIIFWAIPYTLLEIKIDTGRTHQIRVHMAEIGYPVVGDMVYSNGKNEFGVEGQMLHAKSLDFKHPITGKNMHLEAELPKYFKDIIDKLKQES